MTVSINQLRDRYPGETAWIVGCGPSLAGLTADHFGPGPIIALSQATIKVEELGPSNPSYSMQKDAVEFTPQYSTLLVHALEDSKNKLTDYVPRFTFNNVEDFNISCHAFSQISAIEMARYMGCSKVVFLCFDACTTGDIGRWAGDKNWTYLIQAKMVKDRHLVNHPIPHEWVTPEYEAKFQDESPKKMKLAIATPFYEMKGWSHYIDSLATTVGFLARQTDIEFDFWRRDGDSYVDRARNAIANRLLQSDFTHLFFIDSDEGWDIQSFINVLKAPGDVVGAGYPCKNQWDFYGCVINTNEGSHTPLVDPKTGLISAFLIPTGFMKINRTVFEKLALAPDSEYYLDDGILGFDFFGHIPPYKEDGSFNIRCERNGIPRWVEPRVTITHYGVKGWEGNYDTFLRQQPGGDLHQAALSQ